MRNGGRSDASEIHCSRSGHLRSRLDALTATEKSTLSHPAHIAGSNGRTHSVRTWMAIRRRESVGAGPDTATGNAKPGTVGPRPHRNAVKGGRNISVSDIRDSRPRLPPRRTHPAIAIDPVCARGNTHNHELPVRYTGWRRRRAPARRHARPQRQGRSSPPDCPPSCAGARANPVVFRSKPRWSRAWASRSCPASWASAWAVSLACSWPLCVPLSRPHPPF